MNEVVDLVKLALKETGRTCSVETIHNLASTLRHCHSPKKFIDAVFQASTPVHAHQNADPAAEGDRRSGRH